MKKLIIGLLLMGIITGAVACGEAAESTPLSFYAGESQSDEGEHLYALEKSGGFFLDLDVDEADDTMPPPGFEGNTSASSPTAPMPAPTPAPGDGTAGQPASIERMIIRVGDVSLVVEDVTIALEKIEKLAATYNGYVVNSNSWQEGERKMGSISFRVAAEYFEDALKALRGMAVEVKSESTSGTDVTEEYVDLDARVKNLEASETRLLELMEQAGSVEEILEVERELTKTRSEIEQIKGRMQYLEQSTSTSLIQVNLEHSRLGVEFAAHTRTVEEGVKVWFIAEISGGFSPYSYEWDFGDGNTSTDERPYHIYRSEGTYAVSLKVTDDRGGSDTSERLSYITVLPGWDIGRVAGNIWNGLVVFGRALVNILIGIGIFSPVWIVILIILYFAWWRRKKKKNGKVKGENSETTD